MALSVGIVGAGLMGRWHAHASARSGGRITAILDHDVAKARDLAARHRGCSAAGGLRELLDAVDVVHICTPSSTHAGLTRQALDARRHTLVEKPLAAGAADTLELLQMAAARGTLLCPVHQFIFQDGVQQALANRTAIGPLRHIDITICSAGADGADNAERARVAREILPHPLSILQRVLPMNVSDIDWAVHSTLHGEICAMAVVGDATISLLVSMSGRPTTNRLQLIGARGTTAVDLFHGFAVTHGGAVSRRRKMTQPFVQAGITALAAGENLFRRAYRGEYAYPGLRRLIGEFYQAVSQGGACPIRAEETLAVARAWDRLVGAGPQAARARDERGASVRLLQPRGIG